MRHRYGSNKCLLSRDKRVRIKVYFPSAPYTSENGNWSCTQSQSEPPDVKMLAAHPERQREPSRYSASPHGAAELEIPGFPCCACLAVTQNLKRRLTSKACVEDGPVDEILWGPETSTCFPEAFACTDDECVSPDH